MEEKKPIEYVGYVIDRGVPFDGIQKAVDFFDGVGILDCRALLVAAPHWFETNQAGEIVRVRDEAVSMETFLTYWEHLGAKVTKIDEMEAREIRAALSSGNRIDAKFLKSAVDTRKVAGGVPPAGATSVPSGDAPPANASGSKKKGVK